MSKSHEAIKLISFRYIPYSVYDIDYEISNNKRLPEVVHYVEKSLN